jgi:N-acetylmuramoyl-L-alanine amidase
MPREKFYTVFRLAKGAVDVENVQVRELFFIFALLLLLMPHRPALAGGIDVVVIDPGHGGYNSGIKSEGIKEKETALVLSKKIEEILRGLKKKVYLTRKIDHYLSLDERVLQANKRRADVFLSIHLSDSEDFAVYITRYEIKEAELNLGEYYAISSRQRRHVYESGLLAGVIEDILKEGLGKKVYHREMPLDLLGSIGAPAVLIEVPSRGMDYDDEALRVASTIVLGVLYYEQK